MLPIKAQRILGIVESPLVYENEDGKKSNIFGCSSTHNRVAIYSVPHFSDQFYQKVKGVTDNKSLSHQLIVHEFSHSLNMLHCLHPDCALHEIGYSAVLCTRCRKWADRELAVMPGSAEDIFFFAKSYYQMDLLSEAAVLYQEAIALSPREPLYYHCLFVVLHRLNQTKDANRARVSAIAHSYDYPGFHYTSGLIYRASSPGARFSVFS